MTIERGRYLGKYRGTVSNNIDPMQQGRLQATVPDVLGSVPSSWAMACVPFAGQQAGLWAVPPVGAGVWIEFEQGDPQRPIWSGGWWGSAGDPPPLALSAPPAVAQVAIQTTGQNLLLISDVAGPAGGIMIKHRSGAMITINETGITLTNGQATIQLAGPTVTVNNGALAVT
ncbi:baseplate assembly protein [Frankia sp. CNm7]|uniref:Gp5/Type VI secretion system Vgr protein OB-fold domain-containing protein n=1 Tax=Frankia nepalensis TaxID=1836974 RepID=A0A937RA40_9ACTN|nr:phage baseplate assembly protein V [Frankia nepalensis]MBL7501517.1 baseplate assembly protein [Frankia nepalensis]MBL7514230.1 baseplate assembly protein [Frankia nepalensis]MBL7518963.1 baseplate assembly protein [Frankia nepalensis]MBL7626527.1 hypothetical protein [Frankia nepalensis]